MDPLSELLSVLKLETYVSGGFRVGPQAGYSFHRHEGIKCYAVDSGSCWVTVEGQKDTTLMTSGDFVLLPSGKPFCLATDLAAPRLPFTPDIAERGLSAPFVEEGAAILGGHFLLTGSHSDMLLHALPPVVVIRRAANKKVMRWSLEALSEEIQDPQPGGSLIAQQLAYILLVQALRLHLQARASEETGWLFALSDPQMRTAITSMHDDPSHSWTLQKLATRVGMSRTIFTKRFKSRVGMTPMEYLTRWRMVLAGEQLRSTDKTISQISASAGYETDSAFSRAFRKVWKCSPRELRRAKLVRSA